MNVTNRVRVNGGMGLNTRSNIPDDVGSNDRLVNAPPVRLGRCFGTSVTREDLPRVRIRLHRLHGRLGRLGRRLGGWPVLGRGALGSDFSLDKGNLRAKLSLAIAFGPTPSGRKCGVRHVSLRKRPAFSTITSGMSRAAHKAMVSGGKMGIDAIRRNVTTLCTLNVSGYLVRMGKPRFPVLSKDTRCCIGRVRHMNAMRRGTMGSFCVVGSGVRFHSRAANSSVVILPSRGFDLGMLMSCSSGVLPGRFTALRSVAGFGSRVTTDHAFIFMHRVRPLLRTNLVGNNSLSGTVIVCRHRVSRRGCSGLTSIVNIPRVSTGRLKCVGRGPLI